MAVTMGAKLAAATAALVLAAGLLGCATPPIGPSFSALRGTKTPPDQFRVDEATCRQFASGASTQREYDGAYFQCMYEKGNQVPGRALYPSGRGDRIVVPPAKQM